ncbi:probable periplasmic binding protein; possible mechanosensitive ion channel component [Pedobacter sp. BAL39]|uniref:mechanosensitive ion channel domain-containing protein n=1 Tax=Pedobacter sp. BAL39 TaxID=391596 RepID=UPI0001559D4A|nr:mechanosensitive ion channel domain-containing protein [Pedobacter sp. BAL39]EDM35521.1 probable periplasmic binding protein; possible mechanosensitive ion channel component [Pedobacter sp. BAL39]
MSRSFTTLLLAFLITTFHPQFSSAQDSLKNTADSSKSIPDTLLFKIQKAQAAITEINSANKKGYDIEARQQRLGDIRRNISPLQKDFKAAGNKIETKSLMSYNLILKDAQARLADLTTQLMKDNNELQRMSQQVVDLSSDSLLTISAKDDLEKKLYQNQLLDIKQRLQDAGKLTGSNLSQVSQMLADVSALSIVANDLKDKTAEQLQQSGELALGKEESYLWNAPLTGSTDESLGYLVKSSYQGQQQILKYFINSTWDKRIMAILIAITFFIWVHTNFNNSRRPSVKQKIGELKFEYLKPYPVLASLIVLLNITPLFEPDAPSLYIELIQLLLLLVMTIHLRRTLPGPELRYWLLLIGAYALLILGSAAVNDSLLPRLLFMGINIFFIYLGILIYRKVKVRQFSKRYVRTVIIILVLLNVIAILMNLFGRVSLAKVFSATGVIGLTQLIGLAVFVQVMLDALELQIKLSSCNNGIFSRVSHNKTRLKSQKALSILSVILWVMVFLINLNLTGGLSGLLEQILSKQRSFGSIHFTMGNILFFVAIVYISNKLQKHVPLLFGEESITFNEGNTPKNSKVALIRLIIIIIGVLLAVTASGLPMDKLTVILGALGVGIGLGMQNIVNNFVSGIILIFEKPFRIGDYVELADKKGKVQDIGIRSSKLLTPQGSEVIIPNGDLLSGRLVNWTLSNDFVKTELTFKLSAEADIELIYKTINEEVQATGNTMKNLPPEILINSIAADNIEFKVLVWVTNIYVEAGFKSDLLKRLLLRFREQQIKII